MNTKLIQCGDHNHGTQLLIQRFYRMTPAVVESPTLNQEQAMNDDNLFVLMDDRGGYYDGFDFTTDLTRAMAMPLDEAEERQETLRREEEINTEITEYA